MMTYTSGMLPVVRPSQDPNCQRYVDDPNYVWWGGRWRTLEHRERELGRGRWRYQNDPEYRERRRERKRKRRRERRRAKSGIHPDEPVMTRREMGLLGNRLRGLRKAVSDQHAMNVIEKMDSKRAQLMRLAVNEGASPFERRKALAELDKHNARMAGKDLKCQPSPTTSAGTQTPRLLLRSTSS